MNQADAVLLVVLVPFALRGFFRGFLREAFSLAGTIAGLVLAAAWGGPAAEALRTQAGLPAEVALLAAPLGIFVGVYLAANLLGWGANRLAHALFLGSVNRAAGAAFGLAKGAALVGLALVAIEHMAPTSTASRLIEGSRFGRPLLEMASRLVEAGRPLAVAVGTPA